MIEVIDVTKRYGTFEAVSHISFKAQKGEILGLLGPNGAGKTTLMKILTAYHFPSVGSVQVEGLNVEENPLEVQKKIGYLPENAPLYKDLTVSEYLSFICDARNLKLLKREERLLYTIKKCGLEDYLHMPIDELSKGYRQRVCLAQALIHDPEILILDEPTTGLDPNQILEIRSLIKELGKEKTIILSTHILQEAEAVCSKILIVNEGKIVAQGTSEEIRSAIAQDVQYNLVIKGLSKEISDKLVSKIPSFIKISTIEYDVSNYAHFTLFLLKSMSAGEDIFDWAVANNLKIVELTKKVISLEDIFVKLTNEGEGQ